MAESNELHCDPCLNKNVTKSATKWCSKCEKSLCNECCWRHTADNMSKTHHLITSHEYQKSEKSKIDYKTHRKYDEAARGVYTSTAITDLEETIAGLMEKIENGVGPLQPNESNIKERAEVTQKYIATKRAQINTHLDCLEEKLLKVLNVKSEKDKMLLVTPKFEKNQAQCQRPIEPLVHNIDNLQLKFRKHIRMGKNNSSVSSCLILPNKCFVIASFNKMSLTVLKEDGSHDCEIDLPYFPYIVTLVDDKRVAVSYKYKKTCISIINLNNSCLNKTLYNLCEDSIRGIRYKDGQLYAVAYGEGIKVIDLDGNIIKTIRINKDAEGTYKVTTQEDNIYYSVDNGSVYCVDMQGKKIWTCQDERLLCESYTSPAIAVDNYGITFAAGRENNLLLVISENGQQLKIVLTSANGLKKPNAVYYDKASHRLLVCNRNNGHAALYDVNYM